MDAQRPQRSLGPWVIGAVAVIGIGSMASMFDSDDANPEMARVMCEGFVSDRLVSPSSADFRLPNVSSRGSGEYVVSGSVDADNRMGASIRIDYECTVRDDGDGGWTLLDMDHAER